MDPFLEEEQSGGGGFDPRDILRVFGRRKWLFFIPFVVCFAVAAFTIRTMTPIYEAAGAIHVRYEPTRSDLLEDGMPRYRRRREFEEETMITIKTIVTSPKFLHAVIRESGVAAEPLEALDELAEPVPVVPVDEKAVERGAVILRHNMRVRASQAVPNVYVLAVRDPSPEKATMLARVVLDKFLEEELATRTATKSSTRDFLERQRTTYAQALEAAEDSLNSYQRRVMVEDPLGGGVVNATNIAEAEQWLRRLRDQLATTDQQQLREYGAEAATVVDKLPIPRNALSEVAIAEVIRQIRTLAYDQVLGAGLDAEHEEQLGRARVRLNDLLNRHVAALYPNLGVVERNRVTRYLYAAVYQRAKREAADELAEDIREYREMTTRQPAHLVEVQELQEIVAQRRNLLENIEREIAQQTINLEASLAELGYRLEVWQDPRVPGAPVEPDKVKLYVLSFALSLALGLGLVLLTLILDRSFTSVALIEKTLGVPVIGTLPVIQDDFFARQRKRRILRYVVLIVVLIAVAVVSFLVLYPQWS